MLISQAISSAKQNGKLIPARPIAQWSGEPRVFLMCKPLSDAISEGRSSAKEEERKVWAALQAAISLFIEGGLVTDDLIKHLLPKKFEHWELRSRKPRPSLRVFGRFAMPDVFIATHAERRDRLGAKWSPQWEHQKLVCEDHWNEAGLPPAFTDAPTYRYERYITSNARQKIRVQS